MRSPDHNSRELVSLRFQCCEIADATFVGSTRVIDHQNIARLRRFHCFKKNIDAAEMFCGEGVTGEMGS